MRLISLLACFSTRQQRIRAGGKESAKADEECFQTTLYYHHPR